MKNFKKKLKGFSLAELVLAIGIFATISSMLALIVVDSTRTLENTNTRARATEIVNQVHSSLLILKSESWYNIAQHTGQGNKHIEYSINKYTVVDGEGSFYDTTYYFTVAPVRRDTQGNIVQTGGVNDPHSRLINIIISWTDRLGQLKTISQNIYMNDWNTKSIVFTSREDFSTGTHNQTVAIDLAGGELRLQKRFYSDWCKPELSLNTDLSEYDIPGSATPRSVFAQFGHAYLGTRGEATGEPFTKLNIQGVDPPIATVEGTFTGYNVNDIYVVGDYAFLATTDNNKEVVIINISSTPYQEVGYFDAPGEDDAYTVFVYNNIGYVGQMENIHSFNLSSNVGQRTRIGSIRASTWLFASVAKVSQIKVLGDYLYAVLDWDLYELVIIRISNPASMSITSQTSVNNQQVYDMYLSEDGNRAYFGTTHSSNEREFFILDTSTKSGARPKIASLDITDTTIRGIAIVQEGSNKYVIIVGTAGEEYQVYNINNESSPTRCGGMNINTGIYDIDSIRDSYTNAFSYIITGDVAKEFKIIRGGPGGGGEDGYAYYDQGTYISSPFDSGSITSEYYLLGITTVIPQDTGIQIQIRASNNSNMSTATWVGPDGTSNTYYSQSGMFNIPPAVTGRYFQYRVIFSSNSFNESSLLEELIINYEK